MRNIYLAVFNGIANGKRKETEGVYFAKTAAKVSYIRTFRRPLSQQVKMICNSGNEI